MTSVDIGVTESSGTAVGDSLPLLGSGAAAGDFTWSPEQPASPGLPNPGQTFIGGIGGPCTLPGLDCNGNGITDPCDIADGTSLDINGNAIPDECELAFVRGDTNLDGAVDISDPVRILIGLFAGTPLECLDAADTNDSGAVDIADVIALLGSVFGGAGPTPAPGPICGTDPSIDPIDCRASPCP